MLLGLGQRKPATAHTLAFQSKRCSGGRLLYATHCSFVFSLQYWGLNQGPHIWEESQPQEIPPLAQLSFLRLGRVMFVF